MINMAEENNNQNKNMLAEEGKKALKKAIMKKVKPLIIKISLPIILVLIVGATILGIFDSVGDAVQSVLDAISDFFSIDSSGTIVISDEQVDEIINSISELGVSIDGLKLLGDVDYTNPDIQAENEEALRKYIRKFYEAQAMTQTLNTNPDWLHENVLNSGKTYGTVYVYRTNGEDTVGEGNQNQLTYIAYDEMVKLQEAGKTDEIMQKFSIDENGKLVIAGESEVVVKRNGVKDESASSKTITLSSIDYKNAISQYTTSMNFFLYLTIISQNPEFVSAVTDLVKNSDIRITVLDTDSESTETETYEYIRNVKTNTRVETEIDSTLTDEQQQLYTIEENITSNKITETTETTRNTTVPTIKVTYVKTWFCEQEITYNKVEENNNSSQQVGPENQEEPVLTGEGSISWKTEEKTTYSRVSKVTRYEEGVRGNVIDRTGIRGSQGIKDTNGNGKVDSNEKVDENTTFLGLLDNSFKIPNTTRYSSAAGNIVSGAEMLFYLLQKDSASQNLEQILRNVLYKYTGQSYGVTNMDFSIFDIRDFSTITGFYGNSIEEKVWFALREAGYSEYAVAGVMGNIYCESGFDPTTIERSNGVGFGLCQWSYGRRTQLEAYAESKKVEATDLETQLEFLITELTPGASGPAQGYATYQLLSSRGYNADMWKNATDPEFAAEVFCWIFERPAEQYANLSRRREKAREYYEEFKGRIRPTGTASDILTACEEVTQTFLNRNAHYSVDLNKLISGDIEKCWNEGQYICCVSYVSLVLYRAGALTPEQINAYNYQWTGPGGISDMLTAAGWRQVSISEMQPGDVLNHYGVHAMIYAGNGQVWDQSSCVVSSKGNPPTRTTTTYGNLSQCQVWRAPEK